MRSDCIVPSRCAGIVSAGCGLWRKCRLKAAEGGQMNYFTGKDGALIFRRRHELLEIRPWGEGLRIRATENREFT